ncbi:MAG: hypothetical protein A3F77_02590 [Betaproteobacteria bacterium RIFCSPLOWO2_12_FULL_67_28]|nr:MAG: hypothetical protein A3F77_02590 [Betaproteobacteria bacterium RIFCSPLOWO2_12_FULL_67_28]
MSSVALKPVLAEAIIGVNSPLCSRITCSSAAARLKPVQTSRYPLVNIHTAGKTWPRSPFLRTNAP